MRFNCGPSLSDRIATRLKARDLAIEQWHDHFLLWPRRLGTTCVWLETVRRKGRKCYDDYNSHCGWSFEYRLKDEFMADLPLEKK